MIITASPPRRANRNKRVLIAVTAWLGLAVLLFTWSGIQNVGYRGQYAAFITDVRSVLATAPAQVKQAKDSGDVSAVATALSNFAATLSQKTTNAPAVPSVLGLRIGTDAEADRQAQVVVASQEVANKLKQSAELIDFQVKVARSLQTLSLKDAANYTQIIALADAWKEAANILQHETKPATITDVAATLLQKMIVTESRIRELAELYRTGDVAGFNAKQKELATIIDEIKPLGAKIFAISASVDSGLQAALTALQQKL